jgi:hypothetical protein
MTALEPQARATPTPDALPSGAPVYLDPDVVLNQPGTGPIDASAMASDAREALQTLAETGHQLVLVTDRPTRLPPDFPAVSTAARVAPTGRGWFLTTDPERCGPRRTGMLSILVGPGPAGRRAEIHRCDIRTRDLHSAVIEILAREAMAPVA